MSELGPSKASRFRLRRDSHCSPGLPSRQETPECSWQEGLSETLSVTGDANQACHPPPPTVPAAPAAVGHGPRSALGGNLCVLKNRNAAELRGKTAIALLTSTSLRSE